MINTEALPPLPMGAIYHPGSATGCAHYSYTADQMLAYARAALTQPAASGEPAIHWPQVVAYPGGNGGLGAWVDISTGDGPECVVRYVPAVSGEPVAVIERDGVLWLNTNPNRMPIGTRIYATAQPAPAPECDSPKLCAVNGACAGQYGTKKQCATARPAPAPAGMVLVPLRMTQAMREVTDQGEWEWPDLLAAANAVTPEQYEEAAQPAPAPAASGEPAQIRADFEQRMIGVGASPTALSRLKSGEYLSPSIQSAWEAEKKKYATAQPAPARVPLTLEQISRIETATEWPAESLRNIGPRAWGQLMVCVARAIEAAHGIGTPAKEAP